MFELRIFSDQGTHCTLYSVVEEGSELSQVEHFLAKLASNPKHRPDARKMVILLRALTHMNANEYLFRPENSVGALPPGPASLKRLVPDLAFEHQLRLYASLLSPSLVILYGGGIKTAKTNQTHNSGIHTVWKDAEAKARRIEAAIASGIIQQKERYLVDEQGERDHLTI